MKEFLKLIHKTAIIILMFFVSGCYYDELIEEIPPDKVISFATDIQPIFTKNCASCHPVLVSSPDLTAGNSYTSITNGVYIIPFNSGTSVLYQRLLGSPSIMPPKGSLPTDEITLIKNWIEQGALNN